MSVLRLFLLPVTWLYDGVMRIRNRMYDTGQKPSTTFELPIISVGNLSVGGAGKTPMVEYLIRLLSADYRVATLSRGYGRRTKGFRIASHQDSPASVGDEPYQLFVKYGNSCVVTVGEDRVFAIPHLLDQHPETEVLILDDAFQHRRVKPGFSILVTEYDRPFFSDTVLPYGRLREAAKGADRADVIVVTKCPPHTGEEEMMSMTSGIHRYARKPIFFTTIRYGEPQPLLNHVHPLHKSIVLVSGIANPAPLEAYVKRNFTLVHHFNFRDHHHYQEKDIVAIAKFLEAQSEPVSILTTEKDRVKLETDTLKEWVKKLPVFYLPIEIEFIGNGKEFDALVFDFVSRG